MSELIRDNDENESAAKAEDGVYSASGDGYDEKMPEVPDSDTADAESSGANASFVTDGKTKASDAAEDSTLSANEDNNDSAEENDVSDDTLNADSFNHENGSSADVLYEQAPEDITMPLEFPITDDQLTAGSVAIPELNQSFPIVDDEFTARSIDEGMQSSITDIDEKIPEPQDIIEPLAVEIPVSDDDEPDITQRSESKAEKKTRPIDNRFDFLELFVFTMVAVLVLTSFVFRHSIVDGGSMEKTLYNGEHLIISDFLYTPKRGDVIVFQDTSKADYGKSLGQPLVKRVIAVGKDTVRVYRDGRVYVNDMQTPIYEDYTYTGSYSNAIGSYSDTYIPNFSYYPNENAPEYLECTVPEGELFVMGDHRDASTDSREFGTISVDTVLGKVLIRFYPFDSFGRIK